MSVKPLAKNPEKYGKLKVGGSIDQGRAEGTTWTVVGGHALYDYKNKVLALVLFFGLSMFFATKVMTLTNKNSQQQLDPQQEAMQKTMGRTMPIFLTATFFFIPIPAGVLLYLVVSNLFQIGQTFVINKQLDAAEEKKSDVIDVKPEK